MELDNASKKTLIINPDYFGVYLNLARHNIFVINNHISKKVKYTPLTDDGTISSGLLCQKNEILKNNPNRIFTQLIRHMPLAKVFDPEKWSKEERELDENKDREAVDFTELATSLKFCFAAINDFRNDYSHYFSTKKGTDRKDEMDTALMGFVKKNYKRAIDYCVKRFEGVSKKKEVFENKHFKLARSIEDRLFTEDGKITNYSFAFLICLFLDRENAFQFLNKIIGFKGTHAKEYNATREVFSFFCVRLPRDRFISDDPKQSLLLNMLIELSRCPDDLFRVLTPDGKKEFLPKIEDSLSDDDDDVLNITTLKRYENRLPYFVLRYMDLTDSLPAIRFQIGLGKVLLDKYDKQFNKETVPREIITQAKAFGRLDDFLPKTNMDENEAAVIKKINPKEFLPFGFEQFAPHYNFNQRKKRNKIGFQMTKSNVSPKDKIPYPMLEKKDGSTASVSNYVLKQSLPDAFLSIHDLPKLALLEILEKGKAEDLIRNFLIANQAKIFNKKNIEEVKSKLDFPKPFYKKYDRKDSVAYRSWELVELEYRKEKLNELLATPEFHFKGIPFDHTQIPTKILNYWLNIIEVKKTDNTSNRIKEMKQDCKDRLKMKRKGKGPRIGEMATFLAKDIVNMVIDEKKKSKITSFYYDKIQECLALFADPAKKQLFLDICGKELGLFDNRTGHPFLGKISFNNIYSTSEVYEQYLMEKGAKFFKGKIKNVSWLSKTFYALEWNEKARKKMTVVKLPTDLSAIPWTMKKWLTPDADFDQWLKNINKSPKGACKKPVDLPNNLFDNAIKDALKDALKKRPEEKSISFDEKDRYHHLLKLWMGESNIQSFYGSKRAYKIYDETVEFIPNSKPKYKDYFEAASEAAFRKRSAKRKIKQRKDRRLPNIERKDVFKVFQKSIGENEKNIRKQQDLDRIMLLMVDELIGADGDIGLRLDKLKTMLNETIPISQKVEGHLLFDENGKALKKVDKKSRPISRTITAERKRKNHGAMTCLLNDRRMPELFEYMPIENISYDKIKEEIQDYNQQRILLFDRVFAFEKAMIDKDKEGVIAKIKEGKDYENIQHEPYLDWLLEKGLINLNDKIFLKAVRNSFSHNQFPPKHIVDKWVTIDEKQSISKQIVGEYNRKTSILLEEIEKL